MKFLHPFLFCFALLVSACSPEEEASDQKIKDYLMGNPQDVVEILRNAVEYERANKEQTKSQTLAQERSNILKKNRATFSDGKGDITLVEFFDYQCGYCKKAHPQILAALKQDGKVRYLYKEFPILGSVSTFAARAAVAARRQGKYKKFHNALMSTPGSLTEDKVFSIAQAVGLDLNRLRRDIENKKIEKALNENIELGQRLSIRGTPSFIIIGAGIEFHSGILSTRELLALFQKARSG